MKKTIFFKYYFLVLLVVFVTVTVVSLAVINGRLQSKFRSHLREPGGNYLLEYKNLTIVGNNNYNR